MTSPTRIRRPCSAISLGFPGGIADFRAQLGLLNLSHRIARQLVQNDHPFGNLEPCQFGAGAFD